MLIALVYNKKKIYWFEFMFGGFISLGMVIFAIADFTVYPNFNFLGIALIFSKIYIDVYSSPSQI